jgi:hypothetical protein
MSAVLATIYENPDTNCLIVGTERHNYWGGILSEASFPFFISVCCDTVAYIYKQQALVEFQVIHHWRINKDLTI